MSLVLAFAGPAPPRAEPYCQACRARTQPACLSLEAALGSLAHWVRPWPPRQLAQRPALRRHLPEPSPLGHV